MANFLDLPKELRVSIYNTADLPANQHYSRVPHSFRKFLAKQPRMPALLRVSSEIRRHLLPVFYGNNIFELIKQESDHVLDELPRDALPFIKKVKLSVVREFSFDGKDGFAAWGFCFVEVLVSRGRFKVERASGTPKAAKGKRGHWVGHMMVKDIRAQLRELGLEETT